MGSFNVHISLPRRQVVTVTSTYSFNLGCFWMSSVVKFQPFHLLVLLWNDNFEMLWSDPQSNTVFNSWARLLPLVTLHYLNCILQEVTLVKEGGSLGFSIIGGTDHSCMPFGASEPGIFISHVSTLCSGELKNVSVYQDSQLTIFQH